MSVWYEVKVKTEVHYLVEVEDDEDAYNDAVTLATDEAGEWDDVEATKVDSAELEQYKRNTEGGNIFPL